MNIAEDIPALLSSTQSVVYIHIQNLDVTHDTFIQNTSRLKKFQF